jgi:hypothetical protein
MDLRGVLCLLWLVNEEEGWSSYLNERMKLFPTNGVSRPPQVSAPQ